MIHAQVSRIQVEFSAGFWVALLRNALGEVMGEKSVGIRLETTVEGYEMNSICLT